MCGNDSMLRELLDLERVGVSFSSLDFSEVMNTRILCLPDKGACRCHHYSLNLSTQTRPDHKTFSTHCAGLL